MSKCNLLKFENLKDICAAVVSLIQEMTDIESSEESIENIKVLIDYLVLKIILLNYYTIILLPESINGLKLNYLFLKAESRGRSFSIPIFPYRGMKMENL